MSEYTIFLIPFMRKGSLGVTFFSVRPSVCPQILGNFASYDHLWYPNGPEVNRKWTGSDRKWARSGLEVSICLSICLSIPNTSLTSLTNLMQGIYKHCWSDFPLKSFLRAMYGVLSNDC